MTVSTNGAGFARPQDGPPAIREPGGGAPLRLGVVGFTYPDLYDPAKLRELLETFDRWFSVEAPLHHERFAAYRSSKGLGMPAVERSDALLAAAPYVGRFIGGLFAVEGELEAFRGQVRQNDALWRFRKDFVKKRVLKGGSGWTLGIDLARKVAQAALQAMTIVPLGGTTDEERTLAAAALPLLEVDEVARKVSKAGGAHWTDELRARARAVRAALHPLVGVPDGADDAALGQCVSVALDALEAWLASRRSDPHDPLGRWSTMHVPKSLDYAHLVEFERPNPEVPELFVGPPSERRQRLGFSLTDRRMSAREVEQELDYCLFCHDRDKDSCSKGMTDSKTGQLKTNPLG
ncbi:MAG: pyridine nucleotide-disulfide oxidoreductase, partial [Polyangiaceae bacterium]